LRVSAALVGSRDDAIQSWGTSAAASTALADLLLDLDEDLDAADLVGKRTLS
jgi:hypothetical protein